MSKIRINKVKASKSGSLPELTDLERIGDDIRTRAYELSRRRAFGDGHAADDWLRAEREICWPAAELRDQGKRYRLRVALAGFDDDDIEVTATPNALIVKAQRASSRKAKAKSTVWTEFRSNDVVRRVPLPAEIDVAKVRARYKRGILTVEAPKAGRKRAGTKKSAAAETNSENNDKNKQ